jgi:dolichol-phosphate mannosyltransferase
MDADGSHAPEFIAELHPHSFQHDIVIASRYVKGGSTENSPILEFMSRVLNLTYAIVLGIRCRDMSNSFKIYNGDRLRALDLRCGHFDIVEEIMVGFARDGQALRIREVPFTFQCRDEGESKRKLFAFILSYFFTLMRLRFRTWPKTQATVPLVGQPSPESASQPGRRKAA